MTYGEFPCDVEGCDTGPDDGPFVATTPSGLGRHKASKHGVPGARKRTHKAPPVTEAVAPKRTRVSTEVRVAGLVQQLWPKGIPTTDVGDLVRDLHLIDELRGRLS